MRLLLAGLVFIALGLSLTEYQRRSGLPATEEKKEADASGDPTAPPLKKKPAYPIEVEVLLQVLPLKEQDNGAPREAATQLLTSLTTNGPAVAGFVPLLSGDFQGRLLVAGFGYAVMVVDVGPGSALVRLEPGSQPSVLTVREGRITALTVDSSTLFFAESGQILSLPARGGEPAIPRIHFKRAVVSSLAASGENLLATLQPAEDGPGVVVRYAAGDLTVLATDQRQPRSVVTDGKEAFWVADGLWRAGLDGSFSSRIAEGADGPLALDGDAVVAAFGGEVKRMSRAGGKSQTLAEAHATALVASSGLTRYATDEKPARVFEVTQGAPATLVSTLPGPASALALGGTTFFALGQDAAGATTLWAK